MHSLNQSTIAFVAIAAPSVTNREKNIACFKPARRRESSLAASEMTRIFSKNKFSWKVLLNNNLNLTIDDCYKTSANYWWFFSYYIHFLTRLSPSPHSLSVRCKLVEAPINSHTFHSQYFFSWCSIRRFTSKILNRTYVFLKSYPAIITF